MGKTIKIYLLDNDANGTLICELSNWTGKAYKIPRTRINDSIDRNDLKKTGIYFLFGRGESKDLVYIGEAENVLLRLKQHLAQKDFWHEAIVFISKDDNLNKAHIKYLENRVHSIAESINRYQVLNDKTPTPSSLSEPERAEMEEFLENIKLMVNTLGHKVLEEIIPKSLVKNLISDKNLFYIKATRGAEAKGQPSPDGFVVLKDSKFAINIVDSFPSNKLRQKMIEENKLIQMDGFLLLTEDYLFGSPSTAAAIVMGRNANGLTEWRLENGKSLKEIEIDL